MNNWNTESSQGDSGKSQPQPAPVVTSDQLGSRGGNKVYKSGPLFLSSKGIGWTSWKKRWFILTRTSLVFFRSDPSAVPQKGAEVNLTLGGIDLNSSGSVVVKADKKLLTVLFPDGRDGRAFTLKAETMEDLYEWKAALEEALASAPSAAIAMGQNGILRNNQADAADGSDQSKDRQPAKSFVIGRPVLLALEEIDGTPSFLEKALRFLEEYGVKVEGILRQAAAVDDVEHRVREYEQGKREFAPEEDAHVVADCIKYFLRELPSSPVPASCCKALLEACRTDRGMKVTAMRSAICETFPEPNRRLLQRILMMMQTVVSHKADTRMSTSAVAACMAPLLLRPLLAGECDLGNDFDMGGGDGSFQLLQAAAAANHAQAIVITLLEEYDNLFGEGSMSPELYSDSEEDGSESEELSDEYETYEDDDDYYDETEGSGSEVDEDYDHSSKGTYSDIGETYASQLKGPQGSKLPEVDKDLEANQKVLTNPPQTSLGKQDNVEGSENVPNRSNNGSTVHDSDSDEGLRDYPAESNSKSKLTDKDRSINVSNGAFRHVRQQAVWGRTPAIKNLPMEVDPGEEEAEIQKLEAMKTDLQNRIAEEAKINATLQSNLDKRRNALFERRQALEQEVAKLQEQLKKEKDTRMALEAGLRFTQGALPSPTSDEKVNAELEEIAQEEAEVINLKQKAEDLGVQLNQQREQNSGIVRDLSNDPQQTRNQQGKLKDKQKDSETTAPSRAIDKTMKSKKTDLAKTLRQLPQNPQLDLSRISKSIGSPVNPASPPGTGRSATTAAKKSSTRTEGANSTTSALSKLTNRLNFLKERRTQLEQQKQERSGKESESSPSLTNAEKFQGSEGQSSEKGRGGAENSLFQPTENKGAEGSSLQNSEKYNKSDVQNLQNTAANLDKEKSETFPSGDKGWTANTAAASRTNSR